MPIFVREVAMLATVVLVAVMFISCNNNVPPDVEGPPAPSIIGYWKLKYFIDEEGNKREPDISKWLEYMDSLGTPKDSVEIMEGSFLLYLIDTNLCPGVPFCPIEPEEEHYLMNGTSFWNSLSGCYSVDYGKNVLNTFAVISSMAYVSTVPDGHLYEDIIKGNKKSFPFEVSESTLLLYYNDAKECLEFYKIGGADE